MNFRVNLCDFNSDTYPLDYVLTVDYLTHNKYGHSEGQVLVLKPNGKVEFGFIGGDTDVEPYSGYSPHIIWDSLDSFVEDTQVNEVMPELAAYFPYCADLALRMPK